MKKITVYEANDGTRFDSEAKAEIHEQIIAEIEEAMMPLGDRIEITGGQFVRHGRVRFMEAKANMIRIIRKATGDQFGIFKNYQPDDIHPMSLAGRIVDDLGSKAIRKAWNRLQCINENGDEWEQPYFALNMVDGPILIEDRSKQ